MVSRGIWHWIVGLLAAARHLILTLSSPEEAKQLQLVLRGLASPFTMQYYS
jgi:hypothetical protein